MVAAGVVVGAPVTSAALPDGRVYEMVSPPGKNGGDVIADIGRTRAATSGDAVTFGSLRGFGDATGTGIGVLYLSVRDGKPGTNGWSPHSLFPKLNSLSLQAAGSSQDTTYPGELSDDLSTGVLRTLTPLTNAPNVAQISNLYLRSDLLTPGQGTYELLSDCASCGAPLTDALAAYVPSLAGQSTDFGHVIFEATKQLTPDAPAQGPFCLQFGFFCRPTLYEWDHGTLRIAGILPDDTVAPISIAGQNATQRFFTTHNISDDGSRIFFAVPASPDERGGALYVRVDHATTAQLNASERTDCAGDPTCGGDSTPDPAPDPNGSQPAFFYTASADGSKAFFTTDEQLTDDDDNSNTDLYLYDTSLPPSDPQNLTRLSVDSQPADGGFVAGVLGASRDGSYVYFATENGQLVAGEPPLASNFGIFVWHAGTLAFVGGLDNSVSDDFLGRPLNLGTTRSRVTPDGTHLLFSSLDGSGLTGYDHGSCANNTHGCTELYVYDAPADQLRCVSCNPSGAPATANALFNAIVGTSISGGGTHFNHAITDDGSRVFFETGEKLLPDDRNGKATDVYQYDTATGALHLLTSGRSPDDSHFLEASPNGQDAFFTTNERLLRWDTDNNDDLYDARVGGGFPDPPIAAPECVGDACQGALGAPPAAATPKSAALFHGSGNAHAKPRAHKHRKRCAKGKARRKVHGKVRCVRRKHHQRRVK